MSELEKLYVIISNPMSDFQYKNLFNKYIEKDNFKDYILNTEDNTRVDAKLELMFNNINITPLKNKEHSLYINIDNNRLHHFLVLLERNLKSKNLSFDVVVNTTTNSKVILNTNSSEIIDHIKVIHSLTQFNKGIKDGIKPANVLVGNINSHIGFSTYEDGNYISNRIKLLEESFEESIYKWIYNNYEELINYEDYQTTPKEELINITSNMLRTEFNNIVNNLEENQIEEKLGFTIDELNSEKFDVYLNTVSDIILDKTLLDYINNSNSTLNTYTINTKNKKYIQLNKNKVKHIIKSYGKNITKIDKSFLENSYNKLITTYKNKNISDYNFSMSNDTKKQFKRNSNLTNRRY